MSSRTDPFHHRFMYLMLPGLLQGGLGIVVLPITTLILTPEDYGVFALVTALTGAMGALAAMGSSFTMSHRFQGEVSDESICLVSTLMLIVLLGSLILAMLVVIGFVLASRISTLVSSLPLLGLAFALVAMVVNCLWGIATSVAVLSRKVRLYFVYAAGQALITPATVLFVLFVLKVHGPMALFGGAIAGSLVTLAGTFAITNKYLRPKFDRGLAKETFRVGGWMGMANFAELLQRFIERWFLASFVDVRSVGLLTHAQVYPNMLMMGGRPAIQSAWPVLCEESRAEVPSFQRSRHVIHLISIGVAVVAIEIALLGHEVIGLLTNGRFVEAAPYAAVLTAVSGLRLGCGRPQYAVIVTSGRASYASLVNGISALIGGIMVAGFVPLWGMNGAVAAYTAYTLIYVAMLHYLSRRIRPMPFFDAAALTGLAATILMVVAIEYLQPTLVERILVAIVFLLAGVWKGFQILRKSGYLSIWRREPRVTRN